MFENATSGYAAHRTCCQGATIVPSDAEVLRRWNSLGHYRKTPHRLKELPVQYWRGTGPVGGRVRQKSGRSQAKVRQQARSRRMTRLLRSRTRRVAHTPNDAVSNGRPGIAPRATAGARQSIQARRLLQPVPLAGFALMLIGLLVVLGYSAAAGKRTAVLIAAHNLPAGTLVRPSDLRSSRIAADQVVLAALVPETSEAAVIGQRLTVPIPGGDPLARAAVAPASAAPAAFTLALPAANALGGELQPGNRVSVLGTFTATTGGATARVIARDLLVLSVSQPTGVGDPSQVTVTVTVAVPDESIVTQLALANSVAKIDLLREPLRPDTTPIPAATVTGASP
jgi:Flp pilus assembly protein CpaB